MASLLNQSALKKKSHPQKPIPSHMMRLHAKAAAKDCVGLTEILRYHMKNQQQRIASGTNPPTEKESQTLVKTMLRLHNEWGTYNAMLHPPVSPEAYEQERLDRKQSNEARQKETEQDRFDAAEITDRALVQDEENSENNPTEGTTHNKKDRLLSREHSPIHPIQTLSKAEKVRQYKRKRRFLPSALMQDPNWMTTEQPWLEARSFSDEKIHSAIPVTMI